MIEFIGKERTYFVGGVNGAGKSTFLEQLSSRFPQFEIFRGSTHFMEWLGLPPGDYDGLRKLPDEFKRQEVEKMMRVELTKNSQKGKTLIIDAHFFHYKRGEMVDATGEWMDLLDALFVVFASPEIILSRIEEDEKKTGKKRDVLPLDVSREEQLSLIDLFSRRTLEKARGISERYGIPCFVINNNGTLEEAIQEFLRFGQSLNIPKNTDGG